MRSWEKISQLKIKETMAVGKASCRSYLRHVCGSFSNEFSQNNFYPSIKEGSAPKLPFLPD